MTSRIKCNVFVVILNITYLLTDLAFKEPCMFNIKITETQEWITGMIIKITIEHDLDV